jgi:hypothetical protein
MDAARASRLRFGHCSQAPTADLTLAQGNALGLYRQMNESPERACQRMPQTRIGIAPSYAQARLSTIFS